MSDSDTSGFGKFVPGFDFLQNLAKGAGTGMAQMPSLGNWVAPTLNVEDLDKRIEELKNVQFWLEQNSRALAATVQALEVQKMTLATLKGMNFNIGEVANAFKPKAPEKVEPAPEPEPESTKPAATESTSGKAASAKATVPLSVVDPLQLWGSLAQQFQQIAAGALKNSTANPAVKPAAKTAAKPTSTKSTAAKSTAAKSTAAKSTAAKRPATRRASAKKSSRS